MKDFFCLNYQSLQWNLTRMRTLKTTKKCRQVIKLPFLCIINLSLQWNKTAIKCRSFIKLSFLFIINQNLQWSKTTIKSRIVIKLTYLYIINQHLHCNKTTMQCGSVNKLPLSLYNQSESVVKQNQNDNTDMQDKLFLQCQESSWMHLVDLYKKLAMKIGWLLGVMLHNLDWIATHIWKKTNTNKLKNMSSCIFITGFYRFF